MRNLPTILFLLSFLCASNAFSQKIPFGVWVINNDTLIITDETIQNIYSIESPVDGTTYRIDIIGNAVWLKDGIVQIIYNDKPREQGFIEYAIISENEIHLRRHYNKKFSRAKIEIFKRL